MVRFSDDDGFDFAVRCLLNGTPYGMADPGEVLAVTDTVPAGDTDAWFDALTALGARVEAVARGADEHGHRVSAAGAYLRAANYRYAGFWYVLGTSDPTRWGDAWRAHRRCLDEAWARRPRVERHEVAWGGSRLPVVMFRAATPGPAPLLVVQGGLGAPLSDALMTGVDDALARGWHAVAFDGPGAGATRVVDGLGPPDDWGPVVAAVLDLVEHRFGPRLDRTRIAIVGVADGAVLAAQAAAHDTRIAALVCDPGVLRPLDGVLAQLPSVLQVAWREHGNGDAFARAVAAAGTDDPATAFTVAKLVEQWPGLGLGDVLDRWAAWDLTPRLEMLHLPVLVTDPDSATSYPGQAAELAERLGPRATRLVFTSAEGAGLDCEIGAPLVRAQRIGDWLDEAVEHHAVEHGTPVANDEHERSR